MFSTRTLPPPSGISSTAMDASSPPPDGRSKVCSCPNSSMEVSQQSPQSATFTCKSCVRRVEPQPTARWDHGRTCSQPAASSACTYTGWPEALSMT
jgi:hypothetical protein